MDKEGKSCKKGRVVVDIRGLNRITIKDAYPIPTQSDIIAAIAGCPFISTIDCASFFYQWKVKNEHQHRLTVATHRGQETFRRAVMGFGNSPAYVQRRIGIIVTAERTFTRSYIDDIVIFSRTFEEHLEHLKAVFQKLKSFKIVLSAKKCFLGYPSMGLLGQRVDALVLTSAKDKIRVIRNLEFPKTLKHLEYYLGLAGYMRQYVSHYAKRSAALQQRKVNMLRELKEKENYGKTRGRRATS